MNRFGYIRLVIALAVGLALAVVGYFSFFRAAHAPTAPLEGITVAPFNPETVAWRGYTNDDMGFTFSYPEVMDVQLQDGAVILHHAVSYAHTDPCDMRDGTRQLPELTDFSLTLQVFNSDIAGAVHEVAPYSEADLLKNGKIVMTPGYTDDVAIGSLRGVRVTSGVEGCGMREYYFPLSGGRTLYAKQPIVSEFGNGVIPADKTALALPGIIRPEWGDAYMQRVLTSFVSTKPAAEMMQLNIYFTNSKKVEANATDECTGVFPVPRLVPKTLAVARAALEELFKGSTATEKKEGYATVLPQGSALNSISISADTGEADIDVSAATESGGGSCSMAMRMAQMRATLLQFPTVKSVVFSVDGRAGDIFQP